VGLLPGHVQLGDGAAEMNRTLPRGPGVPVKERAGPRRQPRSGEGEKWGAGELLNWAAGCWARREIKAERGGKYGPRSGPR